MAPDECRVVDNDGPTWRMALEFGGLATLPVDVPLKVVWAYPAHEFVDGRCQRCGATE